jgi:hypothetical protein
MQVITLTRFELDGWSLTTWAFQNESDFRRKLSEITAAWDEDIFTDLCGFRDLKAFRKHIANPASDSTKLYLAFHTIAGNIDGETWQIDRHTL